MKSVVVVTTAQALQQVLVRGLAVLGQGTDTHYKDSFDAALKQVSLKRPEFLVLDWTMAPLQESCEFLQKLRRSGGCRNTPVIVSAREFTPQIIAAGSDYGISKVLQEKSLADTFLPAVEAVLQELAKPSSLRSHLVRLEIAAEKQAFGEIDRIVEDFFALYPEHPRSLVEYANLCIRRGNWGKAKQVVQMAAERFPDNLRVLNLTARLTMHEGRMGEAIALLEKADVLSPKNLERLVLFGDACRNSGDNVSARAYYDQALEIDDGEIDARKGKGLVELSEGDVNAALELFRDAASEEEVGGFFNNTAIMAVRGKEFDKAKKLYDAARDHLTTPALKAKVCFNLGLAYRKWEKSENAILSFREALRHDESFDKARRALAAFPEDLVAQVDMLGGVVAGAVEFTAGFADGAPTSFDLDALEAFGGAGGASAGEGLGLGLGAAFADVEVYEETFVGNVPPRANRDANGRGVAKGNTVGVAPLISHAATMPATSVANSANTTNTGVSSGVAGAPVAAKSAPAATAPNAANVSCANGGSITLKSDEKTMSPFSVKVIEKSARRSPEALPEPKPDAKPAPAKTATRAAPADEPALDGPKPPAPKFLDEDDDF